jgi:hypothetical protein
MKTAMQELIDDLKELKKDSKERNQDSSFDIGMTFAIARAELRLEKEKEQIMNAYCDGAKGGANGTKGQHENGWVSIQMRNKYYKQTYNQNK